MRVGREKGERERNESGGGKRKGEGESNRPSLVWSVHLSVFTEFPEALWSSSLCNVRCAAVRRPSVICHGRAGSSCRRPTPPPARLPARVDAATRELHELADPPVLLKARWRGMHPIIHRLFLLPLSFFFPLLLLSLSLSSTFLFFSPYLFLFHFSPFLSFSFSPFLSLLPPSPPPHPPFTRRPVIGSARKFRSQSAARAQVEMF